MLVVHAGFVGVWAGLVGSIVNRPLVRAISEELESMPGLGEQLCHLSIVNASTNP